MDFVPLSLIGEGTRIHTGTSEKIPASYVKVGTGFFETMGIPLLAGRDFGREGKVPVAIINRAMAGKLFPRQNPIGREITDPLKTYTIIGVVAKSVLYCSGK